MILLSSLDPQINAKSVKAAIEAVLNLTTKEK
jgi:hypothetical protein